MAEFAGSLDANVILRLLLNDIPAQHVAVQELFEANERQFAIADTAIIEVIFVLERYYKFTRPQISEAIEGLVSLIKINCSSELFIQALPLFVKHAGLSIEDCCLNVYAMLNNAIPLWTFDKKLANQASYAKLVNSKD
jgi:predicted nucleic-acid-binding protein